MSDDVFQVMPALTTEELAALEADIAERGIVVPGTAAPEPPAERGDTRAPRGDSGAPRGDSGAPRGDSGNNTEVAVPGTVPGTDPGTGK